MNKLSAITDDQFITADSDSDSIKDGLESLGLEPYTDHHRWYRGRRDKINWPPVDEVVKIVEESNFRQAGIVLGVTDNTIRKVLSRNGVNFRNIK